MAHCMAEMATTHCTELGSRLYGGDGNDSLHGSFGLDGKTATTFCTDSTLYGQNGNVTLDGGDGNDTLWGGSGGGNDTLIGGAGSDRLVGGHDSDRYGLYGSALYGGDGDDTLNGGTGNDTLYGGAGSDYLIGGYGSDLYGGDGNDTLYTGHSLRLLWGSRSNVAFTGGAGNDTFVFNTASSGKSCKITDFSVLDDTIKLATDVWAAFRLTTNAFTASNAPGTLAEDAFHIGTEAHDADDRIIYNQATGALTYDTNGNVAGGATQFATIAEGLALTNANFAVV